MNIRFLATIALLAGSLVLTAGEPAQCPACKSARAVQKVYAVADLVIPVSGGVAAKDVECSVPPCCPHAGAWAAIVTGPKNTCEDKLLKLITGTVRPQCWSCAGGPCAVEYFPIGMGLVVHAPADVQEEVAALLEGLRHQQDATVAVSLKFITVTGEFMERFGLDNDLNCKPCGECPKCIRGTGKDGLERIGIDFGCCKKGCCEKDCCEPGCCDECNPPTHATGLTHKQVQLLLEAVQGDQRACVTQAPRVSVPNGQTATVCCQDSKQYVTGVKISCVDGQPKVTPETTTLKTGLNVTVTGQVSADRKFVALHLAAEHAYLDGEPITPFPVTYLITPKMEGRAQGTPVPFTQFVQQPKLRTLKMDTHLSVPSGGTMLVYGGQIERVERWEHSLPPVLSKIPYVSRLFKNVGYSHTTEHLLVMVTPQIVTEYSEPNCPNSDARVVAAKGSCCSAKAGCGAACGAIGCCPAAPACPAAAAKACPAGEEEASAPAKAMRMVKTAAQLRIEKKAEKLVRKYHEAILQGEPEKARKCARQALDLDPECFAKPYDSVAPAAGSGCLDEPMLEPQR